MRKINKFTSEKDAGLQRKKFYGTGPGAFVE